MCGQEVAVRFVDVKYKFKFDQRLWQTLPPPRGQEVAVAIKLIAVKCVSVPCVQFAPDV